MSSCQANCESGSVCAQGGKSVAIRGEVPNPSDDRSLRERAALGSTAVICNGRPQSCLTPGWTLLGDLILQCWEGEVDATTTA